MQRSRLVEISHLKQQDRQKSAGNIGKAEARKGKARLQQPIDLDYHQVYGCPACASGELSAIALMDVFACDFCRHMFTANLQTQSVQLADSLQPMAWQWTGWRWRAAHQSDTAVSLVWAFAIGLTVFPVLLIAISNYVFPPSGGLNFVLSWVTLTGVSHAIISGWLLAEFHQWPWYVAGRIRLQRLGDR